MLIHIQIHISTRSVQFGKHHLHTKWICNLDQWCRVNRAYGIPLFGTLLA